MDFLTDGIVILLAVIGLGFVIAIHELGHFLFAKWANVRVLVYSIGFGPRVWSKTVGETEYSLCLLPVGGYVAMQEEEPEEDGDGRSFSAAAKGWQILILLGGVLFNLISSVLILLVLAWVGMPSVPSIVGDVLDETPVAQGTWEPSTGSQLGLRPGDRIIRIGDERVYDFTDLTLRMLEHGPEPISIEIERAGETLVLPQVGDPEVIPTFDHTMGFRTLGVGPALGRRITALVGAGAEEVPLGAEVQAINGEPVTDVLGHELLRLLNAQIGRPVTLDLDGERTVNLTLAGAFAEGLGTSVEAMAQGLPVVITAVTPGLSAAEQGVLPGDVVVAVDGHAVTSTGHLLALVRRGVEAERPVALVVQRPIQPRSFVGVLQGLRMAAERRHGEGLSISLSSTALGHLPLQWEERHFELEPRVHSASGRVLVGIAPQSLPTGPLAVLPPPLAGGENPLLAAGVRPGDVLVASQPVAGGERVQVRVLRGAELAILEADAAAWVDMRRFHDPSALAKLFGARTRPAALRTLIGSEVLADVDGVLHLAVSGVVELGDPRRLSLAALEPAGAAFAAKLQPGDRVLGIRHLPGDGGALVLARPPADGGELEELVVELTPSNPGVGLGFGTVRETVHLDGWTDAFGLAWRETVDILGTTFRLIPKFFVSSEEGGVDHSKSLHGPIGIFRALKLTAEDGLTTYLNLLALLGLNLVLINLVPLPITDGGRLVFVLIEVVARRPVPVRIQGIVNSIGLALIITLMLYVIGLDLLRLFQLH